MELCVEKVEVAVHVYRSGISTAGMSHSGVMNWSELKLVRDYSPRILNAVKHARKASVLKFFVDPLCKSGCCNFKQEVTDL